MNQIKSSSAWSEEQCVLSWARFGRCSDLKAGWNLRQSSAVETINLFLSHRQTFCLNENNKYEVFIFVLWYWFIFIFSVISKQWIKLNPAVHGVKNSVCYRCCFGRCSDLNAGFDWMHCSGVWIFFWQTHRHTDTHFGFLM